MRDVVGAHQESVMRSLFVVVFPCLVACGDKDDRDSSGTATTSEDCSLDVRTSVLVDVSAASGEDLSSVATVTYTVDGTESECSELFDVGFGCGAELEGDFILRASAEGYEDAEDTVTVEADDCHVITQSVSLVLEPAASP